MTREQMIAWLTLEGYRPYNYDRENRVAFTLSKDGLTGVWCDSPDTGIVRVGAFEVEHEWNEVPTQQLLYAITQLTEEKDHAPR